MSLYILIVEDLPYDAELMALRLRDEGFDLDYTRVQRETAYLEALEQSPDLILCDWHLPQFSGQRALSLLRQQNLDIPFIIVSGGIGEEAAVDALRQGANDYVLKDRPARLGEAVRRVLVDKQLRMAHRTAEEKLRLADRAFQNTAEGITVTDASGNIVSTNPAFEAITGYSHEEVLGQNPRVLKSGHHPDSFYKEMWDTLLLTGHWRGEIWNRRKNGDAYPEWLTISAVKDGNDETTHYVGVFTDISQIKEAQDQINFLAHHDALTRLPNRALFRERFDHALMHARRENASIALLFLDLDRFKTVNDTLGHPVGDQVLLEVSKRMNQIIRASDTLARLGGDEFVLLLEEQTDAQHAAVVARKLIDLFSRPMIIGEHELVVTASIGITLYPNDGDDPDKLIRHADRAMYEAKQQGRNTYRFFTQALTEGALERLMMENDLRRAVARNELILHYQPIVNLETRQLQGIEALVRWQHPEQGLIAPGLFIELAEEIGIIGEIGQWVLRAACSQLARWDRDGFKVPRISVNLSVQQIDREGLITMVSEELNNSGLSPERLELEVTESMLIRNPELSRTVLSELRTLGVKFAIDDFGTGYSSLAYLKLLPLDHLKIDQSFVRDIGKDANDEAIVRAIIGMSKSLGLESVAEGVEEAHQARFLQQAGSELAQGYLYSRPLPADEIFSNWIRTENTETI
ncbi:MAG: EAL domain-containing protein [Candidatus Thiodiazotropha endolucinida]|nr:EAL domain-containing protein [Candidatus Thiodiazotropha taylori]MCW4268999.1 EAL domain-containing protein [Candidatus Thiodiazotropha endolucinida]MCG8102710.1 EAL domain-containing protein [Candidatus Thiodiazotropha taylori]MCG8119105.1 EAL domain-containing protein [Candidatus Thiodiazotropha taylori]MCW4288035.1 EAL domain-containing protein [Candidatus Thiodiazotropha endolucinida]